MVVILPSSICEWNVLETILIGGVWFFFNYIHDQLCHLNILNVFPCSSWLYRTWCFFLNTPLCVGKRSSAWASQVLWRILCSFLSWKGDNRKWYISFVIWFDFIWCLGVKKCKNCIKTCCILRLKKCDPHFDCIFLFCQDALWSPPWLVDKNLLGNHVCFLTSQKPHNWMSKRMQLLRASLSTNWERFHVLPRWNRKVRSFVWTLIWTPGRGSSSLGLKKTWLPKPGMRWLNIHPGLVLTPVVAMLKWYLCSRLK